MYIREIRYVRIAHNSYIFFTIVYFFTKIVSIFTNSIFFIFMYYKVIIKYLKEENMGKYRIIF